MTQYANKILLAITVSVALAFLYQSDARAHSDATGVVKERMMLMEDIGKAMKQIAAMIKGKSPYDGKQIAHLSSVISERGGDHLTKLFPVGSLDKPTEATQNIWTQWDQFSGAALQLTERAKDLKEVANDEKPIAMKAFGSLAKVCSNCHQDFREKKE
ncbi:MAG: cytochrome c [Magnetovibrio sp.]|nr:cytochrome c [Magnetovibrio sp.]